jgi:hypothetical protein
VIRSWQRTAVERFAEAEGIPLVAEFVEAESGKGADALDRRPQLAQRWPWPDSESATSLLPSSTGSPAMSPSSRD